MCVYVCVNIILYSKSDENETVCMLRELFIPRARSCSWKYVTVLMFISEPLRTRGAEWMIIFMISP